MYRVVGRPDAIVQRDDLRPEPERRPRQGQRRPPSSRRPMLAVVAVDALRVHQVDPARSARRDTPLVQYDRQDRLRQISPVIEGLAPNEPRLSMSAARPASQGTLSERSLILRTARLKRRGQPPNRCSHRPALKAPGPRNRHRTGGLLRQATGRVAVRWSYLGFFGADASCFVISTADGRVAPVKEARRWDGHYN